MSKWRDKVSTPQQAISDTENEPPAVILLIKGEDTEGRLQWAYAKIPAPNYMPFKLAEEKGNYNVAEFGEILRFGRGKEPPEEIRREMNEQYGCDENFEDSLGQMMQEAVLAWQEAQDDFLQT